MADMGICGSGFIRLSIERDAGFLLKSPGVRGNLEEGKGFNAEKAGAIDFSFEA